MSISKEDFQELCNRSNTATIRNPKKPKKNKFGNEEMEIDGIVFQSKREGRRYRRLKLQELAGVITGLRRQVPYRLIETFKYKGETIRGVKYYADFVYFKDGIEITEDAKGKRTPDYILKKKMLLTKYPGINFIET